MKNRIKLISFLGFYFSLFLFLIGCNTTNSLTPLHLPNPWTDCKENLSQASEIAGFSFPLSLTNYSVRAMKNIIEIRYPLNENRLLIIRKGRKFFKDSDISGDYHQYPVTEKLSFKNNILITIRKDDKAIYVISFESDNHAYSVNSSNGMTTKEALDIYKVISEAEKF